MDVKADLVDAVMSEEDASDPALIDALYALLPRALPYGEYPSLSIPQGAAFTIVGGRRSIREWAGACLVSNVRFYSHDQTSLGLNVSRAGCAARTIGRQAATGGKIAALPAGLPLLAKAAPPPPRRVPPRPLAGRARAKRQVTGNAYVQGMKGFGLALRKPVSTWRAIQTATYTVVQVAADSDFPDPLLTLSGLRGDGAKMFQDLAEWLIDPSSLGA